MPTPQGTPRDGPADPLRCSGCSGPLPLETLDRDTWTLRCPFCGRTEDLARLRPAAAPGGEAPPDPAMKVIPIPGGARYSWRAGTPRQALEGIPPFLVMGSMAFLVWWYLDPQGGRLPAGIAWGIRVIFSGGATLPLYLLVLVPAFSRVRLEVDGSGLAADMFPFPTFRAVRVPAERLVAVRIESVPSGSVLELALLAEIAGGHGIRLLPVSRISGGWRGADFLRGRISNRFGLAHRGGVVASKAGPGTAPAPGMMMRCPACGGDIPWDALDRRTWTATCPFCRGAADASAHRGTAAEAAALPTRAPAGFVERRIPGGIEITFRPLTLREGIGSLLVVALPLGLLAWASLRFPLPAFLVALPFILLFLHISILRAILRRFVRVDASGVSSGWKELPLIGAASVARGEVLRCDARGGIGGGLTLELVVIGKDGGATTLVGGHLLTGRTTEVRYLARRVNEALADRAAPRGEGPP